MTEQPTNTPLPKQVTLMCDLMAALPDHTQLRNATLKLLATQGAALRAEPRSVQDPSQGASPLQMLSIAQQVVRLNPTAKVSGIKLLRSIFGTSLRDTKLLWEVGASLQGYDTRPGLRPRGKGFALSSAT